MTFEVRVYQPGSGRDAIGRCIRKYASYWVAKERAERDADDYQWGLVVYDTIRNLIDTGNGFVDLADNDVPAPFYARRIRNKIGNGFIKVA